MIDTRRTRRVPGRVFRGDSRAAGRHPGGLRLGLTRDTRRNRRHPGKTHSALGYAAHSGLPGGIRESWDTWRLGGLPEVVYCLGTRGQMANWGDIRGKSSRCGVFGDTWQLGKNPGGEVFRRRLPEGVAAGLRGHKSVSKESFGSTFGTRGTFRRKDRRVWFEGVLKGAFGEMASGTGGALRRAVRQGLRRKLRKEAFGRASERFRKAPKGGFFSGTCVRFRRGSE